MGLAMMQAQRKVLLATMFALIMLTIVLVAPHAANATSWGGRLNGHEWGSSGVVESLTFIDGEHEEGPSTELCVGPVTHDSGGYHFPYGWLCGTGHQVEWEFGAISAAGAVYDASLGWLRYQAFSA
ncbi:MAG TPA: hypothetical protein VK721_12970 [Solirubrobacteraceae bacterium]|nr:hypothetical protein [Solirubrobacteraceae bacterium]